MAPAETATGEIAARKIGAREIAAGETAICEIAPSEFCRLGDCRRGDCRRRAECRWGVRALLAILAAHAPAPLAALAHMDAASMLDVDV